MDFLQVEWYGNKVQTWLIGAGVAVSTIVVLVVVRLVVTRRLAELARQTETRLDDFVVAVLGRTKLFFLLGVGIWSGALVLSLPHTWRRVVDTIGVVALVAQVAVWLNAAITAWIDLQRKKKLQQDPGAITSIGVIGFMMRLVLWTIVLLLVLDNLGVNITALVAGLGIGGIAVALAVQNLLSDLFASLSIVLDKPFQVGDFIIVGDLLGTVEHVGLKTTRVRSLSGEQLVFTNTDLLTSRVRNFKRMYERRVVFTIGVTYQTPLEKASRIPGMLKEIVLAQQQVRFDRSHFKSFGPSSLDFETVYFVQNPDFNLFMDVQQAINLAVMKRFGEEGIDFAYPTQTLYVHAEAAAR